MAKQKHYLFFASDPLVYSLKWTLSSVVVFALLWMITSLGFQLSQVGGLTGYPCADMAIY